MTTFNRSAAATVRFRPPPHHPVALVLFWGLAFLPSMGHLLQFPMLMTSPLMAMGPLAVGFWLAGANQNPTANGPMAIRGLVISMGNWRRCPMEGKKASPQNKTSATG